MSEDDTADGHGDAADAANRVDFRQYDPRDQDAVLELHEWAMAEAGTDPEDIPGTEDLQQIEETYLTAGDFVVGTVPADEARDEHGDLPETVDGALVAMGGFLPSEEGHEDERSVAGAAELHRMRVAPTHQRQGIGRRLLAELEARIQRQGFETVVATTASRQASSVAFYPAAGYREVDRSTYGEYELIHFEKSL
jgi:ribosomal protein S18 acetylase RimI-like enzyme